MTHLIYSTKRIESAEKLPVRFVADLQLIMLKLGVIQCIQ